MKERGINFKRNDDPTLVEDKDGKMLAKVSKTYNDVCLNLGFCIGQLKEGKLTEGMKETHLSLTESYVVDFLKEMGYDGILKKERDARFSQIRSLNEENRELRRQLGEKVSNEDVREAMKNFSYEIKKWWNIYGFGHTSEIFFTEHGVIKLVLSGSISNSYYDNTRESTDEEKRDYLVSLGFELSSGKDYKVLLTDNNYALLKKMLKEKYPSSSIVNIRGHEWKEVLSMREIEVYIKNLDDLKWKEGQNDTIPTKP